MNTASLNIPYAVADAPVTERAAFIRRTYGHLAMAILAFTLLEVALFKSGIAERIAPTMAGSWLLVLVAFMVVSWVADKWAHSNTSQSVQYVGLGVYVVAQAIIFLPLLWIAQQVSTPDVIPAAALITLVLFLGLTTVAFTTRADFSFLGGILKIGGFVALGLIVASIFIGFNLGILFAGAMAVFASAAILYSTSNIIHHYNPQQHVAASLSLFASVALLFWYILRILMSLSGRD